MANITRLRLLSRSAAPSRSYHPSLTTLRPPYKDSQDRTSLKPRSHEGTASGYDEDVSAQPDAAFNPNKTSPEEEKRAAGVGNEVNPLEASGANQELSKPMGGDQSRALDTGSGREMREKGRSWGGRGQKKGSPGRVR